MKDIAIYGAGGFGREMALLVQQVNQAHDSWNLLGFFDDGIKKGAMVDKLPVLGGIIELNEYGEPLNLVLGIADPALRRNLVSRIVSKKVSFPTLVHPAAITGAESNELGKGCVIQAGVIMTIGVKLADFVVVQGLTTIGHDVLLDDYTIVMPGCSISGNVQIGKGCLLGTGARILQGKSIGENTVIGAGAVVTKSFPSSSRLIGVPAQHVPAST
jgi:sugar O-acyltransferase (sialic acid O-acetyltransferase NeuD family)